MTRAGTRFSRAFVTAATLAVAACGHDPIQPPPPDAPTIACPANLTTRGVSGSGQAVTFAAPTTTGGTAPVSVACTPLSGALFPIGTTPVSCAATDAVSRRAQCAFTITLTPNESSVTTYVAFGDSFTEGQNGRAIAGRRIVDVPNAYPTKLQSLLNLEYPGQNITVGNFGAGGERIEDGVRLRLPGILSQQRPGGLLLLDGYNTLLAACDFRVPGSATSSACATEIQRVTDQLREAVRLAKGAGVTYVFVSTLTPPGPQSGQFDRRIAPAAIVQVNAKIAPAVRAEGAIPVDPYPLFLGHEAEYVAEDGLHLRPAGYQVLADTFFAAIKASVASTPTFGSRVR